MPLSIAPLQSPDTSSPKTKDWISTSSISVRQQRKNNLQATWDRYWHLNLCDWSSLEEKRLQWIEAELAFLSDTSRGRAAVFGCGDGRYVPWEALGNCPSIDLCDVSLVALEKAKNQIPKSPLFHGDAAKFLDRVRFLHESLPFSKLPEHNYDCVLAMDLIAEIEPALRRLAIQEMALLVEPQGWVILSTPLDPSTPDALDCLLDLLTMELHLIKVNTRHEKWMIQWSKVRKRWPQISQFSSISDYIEKKASLWSTGPATYAIVAGKRKKIMK